MSHINQNTMEQHRVLRASDVHRMLGISRSTLYDWINPSSPRYDPSFPKRVQLGANSVGWRLVSILKWLEEKGLRMDA
ncbi:MAG: helix-turn-helix transcriptional regulator [Aeromonas veronii]